MQRIIDNCVPHKTTSSRHNLPWFTRSLRRQTRSKQRPYNKAEKSGNESHWAKYRESKRKVHSNLKVARENYVSDFLGGSIKKTPRDDIGISDFEINGKTVSDREHKAQLLSEHFSSVFTQKIPVIFQTFLKI